MVDSIISAIASGIAWLASKGIDSLIGKWLAYFVIAFEQRGNDNAKNAFTETINALKLNSPDKAKAWADWRKRGAGEVPPV